MNHTYDNNLAISTESASPLNPSLSNQDASSINTSTTSTSNNTNSNSAMIRFAQIQDGANHKHCSEGNQKALLSETLNRLGSLTKELEETDWMFDGVDSKGGGNGSGGGSTLGGGSSGNAPSSSYHFGVEERHFSFGGRRLSRNL